MSFNFGTLNTKSLQDWVAKNNKMHPDKQITLPSGAIRGVNWRSEAPNSYQNQEYQWIWKPKEKKWVRLHNYAIQNAYIRYYNDLNKLRREYGDDLSGDGSDDANRAARKCEDFVKSVDRQNQEANAWLHENYNGASFYITDTEKAPTYEKYLSNLSDDQLKKSINYWKAQESSPHTKQVPAGRGKTKKAVYNTGDAVNLHHEMNYNDPNNLVHGAIFGVYNGHSFKNHLTGKYGSLFDDNTMDDNARKTLNFFGNKWNTCMSNQEATRAKINESTKHDQNYAQLVNQYNNDKKLTATTEQAWQSTALATGGKRMEKALHVLFTSGKRQLASIYYLNHTYYDRDQWRLAAISDYLPQRHQDEINASIRQQVQFNMNANLVSIFRKDKKDDTVIGFAENSPSETVDMNVSTTPVDAGMPQTNFAQYNSKQLSVSATIYNRPLAFAPGVDDSNAVPRGCFRAYIVLMNWETNSIPVEIIGGMSWLRSCLIQSLTKSPEPTATNNGLNVQFTLPQIRLAHIKWGKQAKGGKAKGRNNAKTKTHVVKSGQTLSGIAHDNRTTLKAISKANPKIHNLNYIVPGEKVAIPK